jgi:hypothetical protein
MDRDGLTVDQMAVRMKKPRLFMEQHLRLLNLRPEYQDALGKGVLSFAQAHDLGRLPKEHQGRVFGMYVRGQLGPDGCDASRVISAILEAERQDTLIHVEEGARVGRKLSKVLDEIASRVGSCYKRDEVELLGWALDGSTDRNLEMIRLTIKQLRAMEDALRRAKARRDAREPEALSA